MKPYHLLAALLVIGCAQASAPPQNNAVISQSAAPAAGTNAEREASMDPIQHAAPTGGTNAEQAAIMDRIERDVRLPAGAGPLAAYARYYAWQQRDDGIRKVTAVYTRITAERPGRHWVAEHALGNALPYVTDGGCAIISLSYDVTARRIERAVCNGGA